MFNFFDKNKIQNISPSEVYTKLQNKENFVLLDVRTKEEYDEKRIEGSILLPVQELSEGSLKKIGLEDKKDKEILVYCRAGGRSMKACKILKSLGYEKVKNMAGGISCWCENKLPVLSN